MVDPCLIALPLQAKLVIQKQFELEGTITLKMEKVLPTGEVLPTTILIDPLSLGDFPGIRAGMAAGEDIKIVVECS